MKICKLTEIFVMKIQDWEQNFLIKNHADGNFCPNEKRAGLVITL